MVYKIEEKRGSYTYTGKTITPARSEKTLAEIMKNKRREANSARRSTQETQEFLKWALQNCKNQEDLDLSLFYVDIVIELLEKRSEYKRGFSYQKEKIFLLENM